MVEDRAREVEDSRHHGSSKTRCCHLWQPLQGVGREEENGEEAGRWSTREKERAVEDGMPD